MSHDPLCPSALLEDCECYKDGSGIHSCGWGTCQCDLITAAHERGYKEAEAFYTNDCFLCGYAGEWSTSMCWQCDSEQ
jgi:hypothetical protein